MTHAHVRTAAAFFLACGLLAGCDKSSPTTAPPSGPPPKGPMSAGMGGGGMGKGNQEPVKDGKEAFQQRGCARCHTIEGVGGQKGKGPDLTHVGADAAHTKEWIIGYIKDPKATNPESKMPPQRNLSDADLEMLGEYLAGLK